MDIENLTKEWLSAKLEEEAAYKRRVDLGKQIGSFFDLTKGKSIKTYDVGDFKLTFLREKLINVERKSDKSNES